MAASLEDNERKLRAKRLNERLKLLAASLNTIGLTVLGAAVLVPLIGGQFRVNAVAWISVAVGLHFSAHAVFAFLKSED